MFGSAADRAPAGSQCHQFPSAQKFVPAAPFLPPNPTLTMAPPTNNATHEISLSIQPLRLDYDIADALFGYPKKWLMFGSFATGSTGDGTVPDFQLSNTSPCRCARISHGGASLIECHGWCVYILDRLDSAGALPKVKVFHWKGRHVIFIGPFPNRVSERMAAQAIDELGLRQKSLFMALSPTADTDDDE